MFRTFFTLCVATVSLEKLVQDDHKNRDNNSAQTLAFHQFDNKTRVHWTYHGEETALCDTGRQNNNHDRDQSDNEKTCDAF